MASFHRYVAPRLHGEMSNGIYAYHMRQGLLCDYEKPVAIDSQYPYLYGRGFANPGGPVTSLVAQFPEDWDGYNARAQPSTFLVNKSRPVQGHNTRLVETPDVMEETAIATRGMKPAIAPRDTARLMPLSTHIQARNEAEAWQKATRRQFSNYGSFGVLRA